MSSTADAGSSPGARPPDPAPGPAAGPRGGTAGPAVAASPSHAGTVHPAGTVLACLLSVYIAWGSTYLAIRVALTGLPPLLLAGLRALAAGSVLLAWARWRGLGGAPRGAVRNAAIAGVLLVAGGNGGVTIAEQWVSSGLAAAIAASGSMWLVLMLAALGERPTRAEQAGIAIGFAGVVMLNLDGEVRASPAGALALLAATTLWAVGSVVSRRRVLPPGALAVAIELLAGGAVMTVVGLLAGERIDPALVTRDSLLAWLYLVVAGSLIGFSAFTWLIRNVRPALATSFVYVNPIVAVMLGVAVAGERVTRLAAVGVAVSVVGLAVVSLASRPARRGPR